jgi:hypothetical protein
MHQMKFPTRNEKAFRVESFLLCNLSMVRMRGLEPPCLTALAPKTSVSTIPPHPRVGNSAILREMTEKSYTGNVL